MATARRKLGASDFPPEFMDVWNLAVQRKLLLTMESAGAARNMIQRLYTFRKRLMEEAPAIAGPFYTVDLRVHDIQGNVITGKATAVPGPAMIKDFQSTWKAQIHALSSLQVSEIGSVRPKVSEEPMVIPSAAETSDNLSETLKTLGFGTEPDNKG